MNELAELDDSMSDIAAQVSGQQPQQPMMNNVHQMQVNQHYQPGDEKLFIKMFMHPKQNVRASKEEGRPIFEDTEYIEIMQPGNKDSIICRPITQQDKLRFAIHYQNFKNQNLDVQVGTPLSEVAWISKSQIEELKYFGCRTVEQLAGMTDANSQAFAGLLTLKQKAQAWLEEAEKGQAASVIDRLQDMRNELDTAKETIQAQAERIQELEEEDDD